MGGEDGGYLGHMLPDVECSEGCHPLVGLIDNFLLTAEPAAIEAFHDEGRGVAEHAGLVVVAVGMEAIYSEILPSLAVQLVLHAVIGLEVNQHDTGAARYVPPTYADMQAFLAGLLHPGTPHLVIFEEEGIGFVLPKVGADEHEFVGETLLQRLGSRGEDGIDAAHLVADFPATLKDKIG